MTQPGLTFIGMILSRPSGEEWNENALYSMRVEDENGVLALWDNQYVQPVFSTPSFYSNGGRVRVVFEYTGSVAVSSFYIESFAMYQYEMDLEMDIPVMFAVGDTVQMRLRSTLQNNDTSDYVNVWMYDAPYLNNYRQLYPYQSGTDGIIDVVAQSDTCLTMGWRSAGNYRLGASVSKNDVYDGWFAHVSQYEDISVYTTPIYEEDSIYYTSAAKDTVIGSHRQLHNAVLPASVRVVKDSAFFNRGNLAVVSLPGGLEYIGKMAFAWDYALTEVTIPQGVKFIGDNAFWSCANLTTVNFNADSCLVASPTTGSDGSYWPVFIDCDNVRTINIGENVKRIPDRLFSFCNGLRGTLTIPDAVTYIGANAFYHWDESNTDSQNQSISPEISTIRLISSITTMKRKAISGVQVPVSMSMTRCSSSSKICLMAGINPISVIQRQATKSATSTQNVRARIISLRRNTASQVPSSMSPYVTSATTSRVTISVATTGLLST